MIFKDDAVCHTCKHPYKDHSDEDFGPCKIKGCPCPHFYLNVEEGSLLSLAYRHMVYQTDFLRRLAEHLFKGLSVPGGVRIAGPRIFEPNGEEIPDFMDVRMEHLPNLCYEVLVGDEPTRIIYGAVQVQHWLEGVAYGMRLASTQQPTSEPEPLSEEGRALVEEAMVLLSLPAEARELREKRWKGMAHRFLGPKKKPNAISSENKWTLEVKK